MKGRLWPGALLAALTAGCANLPLAENPVAFRPDPRVCVDNPVYIPLGPPAYGVVFERVLDVLDDYFEIFYANRYDGRVITHPRISPGLEQPWKPGSPDLYQRLEATLQTIRRRAEILIQPANDGGFFIQVTVYKELEDLERPTRSTAGAAFRTETPVERQFEVIDPVFLDAAWIPLGRDERLEQVILQRLHGCL
jgi:hypothetical protein